jgi:hypothetical protein
MPAGRKIRVDGLIAGGKTSFRYGVEDEYRSKIHLVRGIPPIGLGNIPHAGADKSSLCSIGTAHNPGELRANGTHRIHYHPPDPGPFESIY